MLTRVTISGADDAVDRHDLRALSLLFPFVEWAFLHSEKRGGSPRYPSRLWLEELQLDGSLAELPVAIHLCGEAARRVLSGGESAVMAERVQLNGYAPPATSLRAITGIEWILQVRDVEHLVGAAHDALRLGASLLFDPSGGQGIEPFRWPEAPLGVRMGYAGGINSENVERVLDDIATENLTIDTDWWIDMESGVRTDDAFDLAKVRAVLERAAPYVSAS
jgi:hypothetical protein